jgi:osmotically inducible protein OsmC
MERTAEARWEGELRSGRGHLKLGSGAFEGDYSFGTRFETSPGTNPEELIGAALAACYSMALAATLAKGGHPATRVESTAAVQLEKVGEGFGITRIALTTRGVVPGLSADEFKRVADQTGTQCIVARALQAVPIRVEATLSSAG